MNTKPSFLLLLFFLNYSPIAKSQTLAIKSNNQTELTQESIKILKKTKASLQVFFNAKTDADEKNAWGQIASHLLEGVVFENDLNPKDFQNNDSKDLPIEEYLQLVQTRYPNGLNFNIDFSKARIFFKKNKEIYVYAHKYMQGDWYFDGKRKTFLNNYQWCRIVLRQKPKKIYEKEEIKIAYLDNDLSELNKAIIVKDYANNIQQRTLEDVAEKLSGELSKLIPKSETEEINIEKISFEGKNIVNTFSTMFTGELKTMLGLAHPSLKITLPTTSRSMNRILNLRSDYKVIGNYLEINATLINTEGTVISKVSDKVLINNAESWAKDIIPQKEYLTEVENITKIVRNTPENYDSKQLQFEIRTNKGNQAQRFTEGEILSIFITANRPCKVRLVYRDATNSLFLMNNNDFEIKAQDINRLIKIPEEFKCAAPFGIEALIGFATTGDFGALQSEKRQGITYILDSLEKIKSKSTSEQTVERFIQITTHSK
ncbi:hypothetical protein VB776_15795 [Arcicella sp. DC2W]|uniref:DUF4384 domain-containing protein n=1 Tax=Arcicella gelida TaxID=2984195 RepID=A0ABU5S7R4_9BACT|nr:hypothetical protein [Arcicella sp. DC2W]MEA5404396.1 hypothetical protein [Arcicella sp. DC2W]